MLVPEVMAMPTRPSRGAPAGVTTKLGSGIVCCWQVGVCRPLRPPWSGQLLLVTVPDIFPSTAS